MLFLPSWLATCSSGTPLSDTFVFLCAVPYLIVTLFFETCFRYRIQDTSPVFQISKFKFKFAKHLQDTGHSFDSMQVSRTLYICQERKKLWNSWKNFYIHFEIIWSNEIQEELTRGLNKMYGVITWERQMSTGRRCMPSDTFIVAATPQLSADTQRSAAI